MTLSSPTSALRKRGLRPIWLDKDMIWRAP
jgi:hypothetical protein